jgi:2-polyprenyl-6-methoxyphenol hydroxylase-like FAD-dependent oxidoreductase
VLVVGAGPVGLVAAGRLAAMGVRPRVVDLLETPSKLSKAVAVHARTLELLAGMGIVDRFLDEGVRLARAELRSGGKVLVHVSFEGIDSPYPFVLDLPQDRTEAILGSHLDDLGVTVERGAKVTSLSQEASGVQVTLERHGASEEAVFDWVVGCDGGHSAVRSLAPTKLAGSFHGVNFILADVDADWSVDPGAIGIHLHPDGIAGSFPLHQPRVRLVLEVRDEVAAGSEPTLEEVQRLTADRIDATARLSNPRWLTYFQIHHGQVPQYRFDRVLLAGDAAHIHSPAGGQGMNTGVQDADNLAWKLALVAKGRASAGLLDSYNAERHPVGASVVKLTSTMTDMATSKNPAAALVRDVLLRVMGATPLPRKMAEEMSEVAIGYPKSPIVGSSVRHGPRPGTRAPDLPGATSASRHTAVVVGDQLPVADPTLVDISVIAEWPGSAHAGYGPPGTMTLVRPDGYVGYVAAVDDADAMRRYFGDLLGVS